MFPSLIQSVTIFHMLPDVYSTERDSSADARLKPFNFKDKQTQQETE